MKKPDYIKDSNTQIKFLSYLGNVTPSQEAIFKSLCIVWQPIISFDNFFKSISQETFGTKMDIINLIKRLQEAGYAVLVYDFVGNQLEPSEIIITELRSKEFYYYSAVNLYRERLFEKVYDFFSEIPSKKRSLGAIPKDFYTPLKEKDFTHETLSCKENHIYLISEVIEREAFSFFIPSGIEEELKTMMIRMAGQIASLESTLTLLSRALGVTIGDAKKQITSHNPYTWLKIISILLENWDDIQQKNRFLTGSHRFIISLFSNYLKSRSEAETEKKRREHAINSELKVFEIMIHNQPHYCMIDEKFDKQMATYQQKWEEFPEAFRKQYLEPSIGSLPVIITINNYYIHRDRIYTYFRESIAHVSENLKRDYEREAKKYFSFGSSRGHDPFITGETFINDISEKIEKYDPILKVLLDSPKMVSEAIISEMRENMPNFDPDQLKATLFQYFREKKLEYLSLTTLFDIDIKQIFYRAKESIPFLSKLLFRMIGKYSLLQKRFKDLEKSLKIYEDSGFFSGPQKSGRSSDGGYTSESSGGARREAASGGTSPTTSPKAVIKKRKGYTKKQQQKAWEQFESSLRKK